MTAVILRILLNCIIVQLLYTVFIRVRDMTCMDLVELLHKDISLKLLYGSSFYILEILK